MTPKERKVIFTLIGVMFLIMVTVIITKSSKNGKSNATAQSRQNSEVQDMSSLMQGVVQNNVNGGSTNNNENNVNSGTNNENNVENTTENNTENNNEGTNVKPPIVAMYKELLITDVKYESENGGNKIVANIRNTGSTNFISEVAKLTITTSTGEKIEGVITIPSVNAGETSQLEYLLDEDASNITDINIEEI